MQEQSFIRVRYTGYSRLVIEYLDGFTPETNDELRESLSTLSITKKDAEKLLEMLKAELEELKESGL